MTRFSNFSKTNKQTKKNVQQKKIHFIIEKSMIFLLIATTTRSSNRFFYLSKSINRSKFNFKFVNFFFQSKIGRLWMIQNPMNQKSRKKYSRRIPKTTKWIDPFFGWSVWLTFFSEGGSWCWP